MRKAPRKRTSTNYRNETALVGGCPLAAAMKLLGGRWKPMILYYIHHAIDRFASLRRTIPSISEKMLWQNLRELEADGLVVRSIEGPRSVRYALTPLADSLVPTLESLARWSEAQGIGARLLAAEAEGAEPTDRSA